MASASVISKAKLDRLFAEEDTGKVKIDYAGTEEVEGFLYSVWVDTKSGKRYAVRQARNVHMGFNTNEPGKEEEFLTVMKREGMCNLTWGVTGRTMHSILGHQMAQKYPMYRWEIGYNYEVNAYDDDFLM